MQLVLFVERNGVAHEARDFAAVAYQKEEQIEHHAEAHHELQRVLPEAQRARGDELADLRRARRQSLLQAGQIHEVVAREHVLHRLRQRMHDLAEERAEVETARAHLRIGEADLLDQRAGDQREREDHDHETEQQRDERGEIAPASEARDEAALHGLEDQRENGAPQHGAEKRREHEAQRDGNDEQQQVEGGLVEVLVAVHERGIPVGAGKASRGACRS
ncbi:hypothetical protein PT2222_190158 [Paraburkholderia tropica]